ncbi:MAG: hypothetical protein AAF291_12770 [Pseudomonadota bacterium]
MSFALHEPPPSRPVLGWLTALIAGVAGPVLALIALASAEGGAPLAHSGGPIFAVALMGMGMITAALDGRLWVGVLLAVLTGVALLALARLLGVPSFLHSASMALAVIVAALSFAARGTLFARSVPGRGWWIAVFVVAGEAAVVFTAWAAPGSLPEWLLALLPAQWASVAIQSALTGTGARGASSALIALAGTAAATLVVVRLWPRRWTYGIMFSVWLAMSALVFHRPAMPL